MKLIAKVVPTTAEVLTAQELIPCCTKAYPASSAKQHQVNGISEVTPCKPCQHYASQALVSSIGVSIGKVSGQSGTVMSQRPDVITGWQQYKYMVGVFTPQWQTGSQACVREQ